MDAEGERGGGKADSSRGNEEEVTYQTEKDGAGWLRERGCATRKWKRDV